MVLQEGRTGLEGGSTGAGGAPGLTAGNRVRDGGTACAAQFVLQSFFFNFLSPNGHKNAGISFFIVRRKRLRKVLVEIKKEEERESLALEWLQNVQFR